MLKFAVLRRPARRTAYTCSVGLPAVRCNMVPVRTLSEARTLSGVRTLSGTRTLSGVQTLSGTRTLSSGGAGAAGWYSSLSDSPPVHLCEQCLVSLQQVSGLPWWLNIVISTLAVRTLITLPLAAYQMVIVAKVSDRDR